MENRTKAYESTEINDSLKFKDEFGIIQPTTWIHQDLGAFFVTYSEYDTESEALVGYLTLDGPHGDSYSAIHTPMNGEIIASKLPKLTHN